MAAISMHPRGEWAIGVPDLQPGLQAWQRASTHPFPGSSLLWRLCCRSAAVLPQRILVRQQSVHTVARAACASLEQDRTPGMLQVEDCSLQAFGTLYLASGPVILLTLPTCPVMPALAQME